MVQPSFTVTIAIVIIVVIVVIALLLFLVLALLFLFLLLYGRVLLLVLSRFLLTRVMQVGRVMRHGGRVLLAVSLRGRLGGAADKFL